jgi:type IV secretory pathway VirB6-like protein
MAVVLMIGMLTSAAMLHPAMAQGANVLVTTAYGEPPIAPENPAQSQTDPYLYDLRTSMQVSYWGAVVDGIGQKFAGYTDLSRLDSTQKIWNFIEDERIEINEREAQVLCLFMEEGDPEPGAIVPTWPAGGWPECGGVLDTMFGPGAAAYIAGADDNTKQVFQYLLESMGIAAKDIEPTIGALAGAGPDDIFNDDTTGDARDCYTPGNNIRTYDTSGCGVLCTVTRVIMGLLNTASEGLVEATANNAQFQNTVLAVLTLYVTIYGAMVVLGLVNVALGDAVVRVLKLSVVAMLLTSSTVMTLFHMARCFFIEGTTYLVNAVTQVGLQAVVELNAGQEIAFGTLYEPTGNANLCGSSFDDAGSAQGPLVILEALLTQVFSAHMFLNLITLFLSKFYGIVLGIFLIFGLFGFVMTLLGAVTIYLSALIGQYLLLSLLPFFVVFLLFEKTNHLFQGWLNQLITYSLTPIFLFAYISLFVVVTSAALAQILDVKICWAKWFTVAWVFDIYKYQYFDWETHQPMPDLPFGFFEVLIFVLLVFLMREFENSVEQIARDIGNSYVYVNKAARELQGWFKGKANKIKAVPVKAAKNLGKNTGAFARGAVGGHGVNSSSGQRGTGGIGGGKRAVASRSMASKATKK